MKPGTITSTTKAPSSVTLNFHALNDFGLAASTFQPLKSAGAETRAPRAMTVRPPRALRRKRTVPFSGTCSVSDETRFGRFPRRRDVSMTTPLR